MRRKLDIELKAGIFVFLGLTVLLVTILLMGGGSAFLEKSIRLYVNVPDATGVSKGAVVRSGGLKVGRVEEIAYSEDYTQLRLTLLVNEKYQPRIKKDSQVKFQTQGVLGDKFLEIKAGASSEVVADKDSLEVEPAKDLAQMLSEGQDVVSLLKENLVNLKVVTGGMAKGNQIEKTFKDLSETATNLKQVSLQLKDSSAVAELGKTMKNLRSVSEKMKNGEGTIGALFNDASLYEDLKNLIGGANRNNVLKFFVRQAVKSSDDASEKEAEKKKADRKPGAAETLKKTD